MLTDSNHIHHAMSTKSSSGTACDHGYNTPLINGHDPYKAIMNEVVRHMMDTEHSRFDDVTTIVVQTGHDLMGPTLFKKLLATGLLRLQSNEQLDMPKAVALADLGHAVISHEHSINTINHTPQTNHKLHDDLNKLRTERQIRLAFYDRAQCGCFEELKTWTEDNLPDFDQCSNSSCNKFVHRENLLECSKCRKAAYCSTACQENDWPAHKARCKILRAQNPYNDDFTLEGGAASQAAVTKDEKGRK